MLTILKMQFKCIKLIKFVTSRLQMAYIQGLAMVKFDTK